MSALYKQIEVKPAGRSYSGWRSSPTVEVTERAYAELIQPTEEYKRFTVSLNAYSSFTCRFGDYNAALDHAKRMMVRTLHQHVFGIVDEMRRAVYAADEKEMLQLCDRLEVELGMK